MRSDHVATVFNTPNDIPQDVVDVVLHIGDEAFIEFVVSIARAVERPDLTVEQCNLLAGTILADVAGALRPLARMANCTDGASEVLPQQMREILADGLPRGEVMRG